MKASKRWKRVRRVDMVSVGVGVTCSASTEAATVTIGIVKNSYDLDVRNGDPNIVWESFQIEGTPEEMDQLSDKLIRAAREARALLASNKAGK